MSEVDKARYCRRCRGFLLDEETISDRFPDLIPFCPHCQERLEGVSSRRRFTAWMVND